MSQQVIHMVNKKPYVCVPEKFKHKEFLAKFKTVLNSLHSDFDKIKCCEIFGPDDCNKIWDSFVITNKRDIVTFFLSLSQKEQELLISAMIE